MKQKIFDSLFFLYALLLLMAAVFGADEDTIKSFVVERSHWLLGLLAVSLAISEGLNRLGLKTLGTYLFQPDHLKAKDAEKPLLKQFWFHSLAVVFVATCVASVIATQVNLNELLNESGRRGALDLFGSIFNPNFQILPNVIVKIIETIFMAFLATLIATPIAFLLSFLMAKNIMSSTPSFLVYMLLRTTMNIMRSIEPIVWATIFAVWAGFGPFAGSLALMIHSVASLAKQYSELVESADTGPIEGIRSTGANSIQTIWYAIVPQVFLPFLAFTIYRWDINVRMATIIGMVGGGGVGSLYILYSNQSAWPEVGCIIVVIALVVWLMDNASAFIREALK